MYYLNPASWVLIESPALPTRYFNATLQQSFGLNAWYIAYSDWLNQPAWVVDRLVAKLQTAKPPIDRLIIRFEPPGENIDEQNALIYRDLSFRRDQLRKKTAPRY